MNATFPELSVTKIQERGGRDERDDAPETLVGTLSR
jgi:hypothetical protein